jgi:hypothetical protein
MSYKPPEQLSHYVGTLMLEARGCLEDGDVGEAEKRRLELLKQLKDLGSDPTVISCIDYLEGSSWKSPSDIDAFDKHYESINPDCSDFKSSVSRIFGKP